jgi:hypothetical protein
VCSVGEGSGGLSFALEHSKVCTLCDFGHLQFSNCHIIRFDTGGLVFLVSGCSDISSSFSNRDSGSSRTCSDSPTLLRFAI